MATRAGRICGKPGCRGVVRDGVCSGCGPRRTSGWQNANGSRQSRGYDDSWIKLRSCFVQQKRREAVDAGRSLDPICALCDRPIERAKEIHVDHIVAFGNLQDPLRLDSTNLRAVHIACHMRHTARARRSSRAG
jgi:hypothetical protein